MLNNVLLVGRLTENPEERTESSKTVVTIVVAIQRGFKNSEGLFVTDFIKCTLWNSIAPNAVEYLKKGDIVGIKGRIQTESYKTNKGITKYNTEVLAEKITFLSNKE